MTTGNNRNVSGELNPSDLSRALSDIPIVRELQRLILSGPGPINWHIAKQIADAISKASGVGSWPDLADRNEFTQAVRIAELNLSDLAGGEAGLLSEDVMVVGREEWAALELAAMRPYVERLAMKLIPQLTPGAAGQGLLQGMGSMMAPLLFGVQIGFLVGHLCRDVMSKFDLCLPRGDLTRPYFVYANIVQFEDELELDPQQFRLWLALHEVAHHAQFKTHPWMAAHLEHLLQRFVDGAEVNAPDLLDLMSGVSDPEELNRLIEKPEELLPMLISSSQQDAMLQMQNLLAVIEGHADWLVETAGRKLLVDFDKMREGINRRRVEKSSSERMLQRLLGIDLPWDRYSEGVSFIKALAQAEQIGPLLASAENLPTAEELQTPSKWITRVAFS